VEPQSRLNQSLSQSSLGQSIVILDFGSQFTQLIARRIREQNVFSVVLPCTASLDEVTGCSPVGIVLSGAPWSVYDKDAPPADPGLFELGLPVLGLCYGLQFMVHTLGGKVRPADKRTRELGMRMRATAMVRTKSNGSRSRPTSSGSRTGVSGCSSSTKTILASSRPRAGATKSSTWCRAGSRT